MTDSMRVALRQHHTASDDYLTFAAQLGVSGVQLNLLHTSGDLSTERGILELDELLRLRARVEARGLRLEAIENLPQPLLVEAMLGLPGRDECIANYQTTLRNLGAAGIPVLGLHWMPNSVWRTAMVAGRGGVRVTAWDQERALEEVGFCGFIIDASRAAPSTITSAPGARPRAAPDAST